MTELSLPWVDSTDPGPQVGDGRPYTAAEWDQLWEALYSGMRGASQGVLRVWNELACTTPGANQINVDTGIAVVKGHAYWNDAALLLEPPSAPAGNVRKDSVILRCDWSGGAQYTVRCVVKEGTAGAYPDMTQTDNTLWELRLYNYTISDAGAISGLTRMFSFAEPGLAGWIPLGGIIMWSGTMGGGDNHYPTVGGEVDTGWHLANGETVEGLATPDLRDRFIVGAGSTYAIGATGGAATVNLEHAHTNANESAHTHTQGVTGAGASHSHGVGTLVNAAEAAHTHTQGNTGNENAHTHTQGVTGAGSAHSHGVGTLANAVEASHTHTQGNTGSENAHTHTQGNTGAEASHTHTQGSTGTQDSHIHNLSSVPSPDGSGVYRVTGTETTPAGGHAHTNPTTSAGSSHAHTNPTTAAGTAHLHSNPTTSAGSSHNHAISGSTATEATHTHANPTTAAGSSHAHSNPTTSVGSSHNHTISGSTAAEATHTHSNPTTSAGSAHAHTMNNQLSAATENRPPFYSLAFLMRVK